MQRWKLVSHRFDLFFLSFHELVVWSEVALCKLLLNILLLKPIKHLLH